MKSKVILSNSFNDVYNELIQVANGYDEVYYIYSDRDKNVSTMKMFFDFEFIKLDDVFTAIGNIKISGNVLFIVSHLSITKIPDTRLGVLRRSDVDKIVIDNHPFLGTANTYYCYFLYFLFDKSLLGYPHIYAFRDARITEGNNPFDVSVLANKVSCATDTYISTIYTGIESQMIELSQQDHLGYSELKENLFNTETSPKAIIRKLKKFVDSTETMRRYKSEFSITDLNRVFQQYQNGSRKVVYSNAKVDVYLFNEFSNYIESANGFVRTLWEIKHS